MLILAIDCAGAGASAGCHVCVWHDGKIIAAVSEVMERGQDAHLIPLVMDVMAQARLRLAERGQILKDTVQTMLGFSALDRIAVTRGPGSFTGLRIGLAAARGLGLAAQKQVIGIDRFTIHQAIFTLSSPLLVVLESKRQELFCKYFGHDGVIAEAAMLSPQDIAAAYESFSKLMIVGDGAEALRGLLPSAEFLAVQKGQEVATCAALAAGATIGDVDVLPRPLYLRAPDVTIKATNQNSKS